MPYDTVMLMATQQLSCSTLHPVVFCKPSLKEAFSQRVNPRDYLAGATAFVNIGIGQSRNVG